MTSVSENRAYAALRGGAGFVERTDTGRIALTGADRRSYLQGLLTNDIEALTPGTGCYAAMLTAQGRMIDRHARARARRRRPARRACVV